MRRLLQAVLVIAAVVAPSGASGSANGAQTLLDRNKAFAGWVFGDPAMMSLRMAGTLGDTQMTDLRRGAIWRRTDTNPKSGLTYARGFTGRRFWYSNENGFTVPLIGDAAKYQIAYQMVMNQALPLLPGVLHGNATVNGTPTQIVRLTPARADVIDAYIDPSSGRLVRAVIDPDGSAVTLDILAYADLAGKKIISKWRSGKTVGEFTNVESAPISDAEFHPPPAIAYWTFGAPDPIPITVSKDYIVVRATVEGVPGNFLLDSGAAEIVLNSDFADRAHLKPIARETAYGFTGAIHTTLSRVDTFAVGQSVLHDVVVGVGANAHGRRSDFDGFIGFDFFAGAIVDVDVARQTLTIFDPVKYEVTARGPEVIADLSRGFPEIPATFNGRVRAHVVLDTGNQMAVVANNDLYRPGKVDMRFEGYAQLSGAGGDSQTPASCGHTDSIEMGPIRYENVPVCFTDLAIAGKDGGVVGFDFLRHFDLTFDYPDSAIYLTPTGK